MSLKRATRSRTTFAAMWTSEFLGVETRVVEVLGLVYGHLLLERLSVRQRERSKHSFTVWAVCKSGRPLWSRVTQSCACTLCLSRAHRGDVRQLRRNLGIKASTFTNMNRWIVHVISSLTAPLRLDGIWASTDHHVCLCARVHAEIWDVLLHVPPSGRRALCGRGDVPK